MNISIQQLLEKMEKELLAAKISPTIPRMRENIHTIKSLCELILDIENIESHQLLTNTYSPERKQSIEQPTIAQQPKRMQLDNEANGDSIFDF